MDNSITKSAAAAENAARVKEVQSISRFCETCGTEVQPIPSPQLCTGCLDVIRLPHPLAPFAEKLSDLMLPPAAFQQVQQLRAQLKRERGSLV